MNTFERMKATFEFKPVDHLVRTCFYFWPQTIERWKKEGLDNSFTGNIWADEKKYNPFHFDPCPWVDTGIDLGWVNCPFVPPYEEKVLKIEGNTEIIQDKNGTIKKVFQGISHGFMPVYFKSCVENRKDWENDVKHRLDPQSPERWENFYRNIKKIKKKVEEKNFLVSANVIGGYMYLRNLFGPEKVLYIFYDDPDLVHECMKVWRNLILSCLKKVQEYIPIFRFYIAEDICFKTGPLISPEHMKEFLIPYYREIFEELKSGQKQPIYFEVDTDGNPEIIIPVYMEAGMNALSPFEVAAGCDVVKIGKKYPNLIIRGGIDKRILAKGPEAILKELNRIMPEMVKRGGFIPSCDHGVPPDVSLSNYQYYRNRVIEMDH